MLRISVGTSRKLTQDYNSKGFDIHLDGELPCDVINDPNALAEKANELFQLAEDLINEQVAKHANGSPAGAVETHRPGSRELSNRNEHSNGSDRGPRTGITAAQRRAIANMLRRAGEGDGTQLVRDEYGVNSIDELSIKEASTLIDDLKERIEAQPTGRRSR